MPDIANLKRLTHQKDKSNAAEYDAQHMRINIDAFFKRRIKLSHLLGAHGLTLLGEQGFCAL